LLDGKKVQEVESGPAEHVWQLSECFK
jgi:hypothetical protein